MNSAPVYNYYADEPGIDVKPNVYSFADGLFGSENDAFYDPYSMQLGPDGDDDDGNTYRYFPDSNPQDNSMNWVSSPSLSVSSTSDHWVSPTFGALPALDDTCRLDDSAVSPSSLPQGYSSPTAQKHIPAADPASDSLPRPTKKAKANGSAASSPASGAKTRSKSKPKPKSKPARTRSSVASQVSTPADDDGAPAEAAEERKARHNHNIIEKQYRSRLNTQFERLLAVLPAAEPARDGRHVLRGATVSDGEDKRMSKAEVLDLARRRICALEKERAELLDDRIRLLENVTSLRRIIQQQQKRREGDMSLY